MDKKIKFQLIDIEKLIPYARNSRIHSQEQVDLIAKSISEYGFINPVIIDKDNGIVAGHGRIMAAKQLNIKNIPCVKAEYLTESQKRAYVIMDNKSAELATWNEDILKIELEELKLDGFDLELTGFNIDFLESQTDKEYKEKQGVVELNSEDFSDFDNKCPRCGFEFDDKKEE